MRWAAVTIGVVLALVCAPGAALGARPATTDEKAAVLAAFGAWSESDCYAVTISTAASGWASVSFAGARPGESLNDYVTRCNPADGQTIMRDRDGWAEVTAGSGDGTCPRTIPLAVGRDLRYCRAPRTYVVLGDRSVQRPRTLPWGAHGALVRLHWRGWGTSRSVAAGTLDYVDATTRWIVPIKVYASARATCGVGDRYYRRLRVAAAHRRDHARIHALETSIPLTCS